MNNKLFIILLFFSAVLGGCTNLDVDVKSELTPGNFPTTEEQFVAASGAVYTDFAYGYCDDYWRLTELSGDGALLTANGGNWFDGGMYMELHMHSWNSNSPLPKNAWAWLYKTVNNSNKVLELLKDAPDSEVKKTTIAELRTMRSFAYYLLMDNFGGVPIMKEFGEELKGRDSREMVFSYVEQELLECVTDLSTENSIKTWGRPTQLTAYSILAKLYLNAEVFIGQKKYNEALAMCDKVIDFEGKGQTELTPRDKYLKMFDSDNGPEFKEIIFAIPYDENNLQSFRPSRYYFSIYHQPFWGLKYSLSSCMRVNPDVYDLFIEEPNDVREKTFMTEKQYLLDGVTPMVIPATKVQLDSRYKGADKDEKVNFHIRFTKELVFRDKANFDMGDDVTGRLVGYRSNKFPPNLPDQPSRYHSNDFPVFRYADILLMKAECILRGATPTKGDSPESLVNRVRTRAGVLPKSKITLDMLLDERSRELFSETWRRNDLIRFGKFEDSWVLKTDKDPQKRLYAIPKQERENNPLLTQNPGY